MRQSERGGHVFRTLILLGALLPAAAGAENHCRGFEQSLKVSVLNVGLGESLLVTCPDGSTQTLIDAGDTDAGYPGADGLFEQALLRTLGDDRRIETAVLTHPHPDHSGGFLRLFQRLPLQGAKISIGRFVEQGIDFPESAVDEELRQLASKNGIPRAVYPASALDLCPGSVITEELKLSEAAAERLGCPANLNDCSIKLKLTYEGVSFLLLADATFSWEQEALADPVLRKLLPATVLKVGHHASAFAGSAELLSAVQPRYAAISAGLPELGRSAELGYPGTDTLLRLQHSLGRAGKAPGAAIRGCRKNAGACTWEPVTLPAAVFATSVNGTVSFYAKGGRVCAAVEREQ